jgi:hypothetical protein
LAIRKAVIVEVWGISDGESTEFTVDLAKDPYWVGSHRTSGVGGIIQNWDSSLAHDVIEVIGAESVSINGTVVLITVPLQPAGYKYEVAFHVLFEPSVAADVPVNVTVPMVSGPGGHTNAAVGDTLTCTMGEWLYMQAEPHSYAYEWIRVNLSDSSQEDTGGRATDYTLIAADGGCAVFCYLTATNTLGSAGVSSNQVTVTGGTRSGVRSPR